jgi:flavin-dependent dehydrogenase
MLQGGETETVEVAVVGAGPAGLAVAIKLHKVNKKYAYYTREIDTRT